VKKFSSHLHPAGKASILDCMRQDLKDFRKSSPRSKKASVWKISTGKEPYFQHSGTDSSPIQTN